MKSLKIIVFIILMGILFLPNKVFAVEEYTISTIEELKKFAEEVNSGNTFEEKTVNLMANIDLNGSEDNQWTPIGLSFENSFKGTFEGNGHIVKGVYMHPTEYVQYNGFFGQNSGNIYNLGVEGTIIIEDTRGGGVEAGGLAARNNNGTIRNCFTNITIINNRTSITIGGIIATNSVGTIENCYAKGSIIDNSTAYFIGGILGCAFNARYR